jgi:hypothetical protein
MMDLNINKVLHFDEVGAEGVSLEDNESNYLKDDVKEIIVETDENDPKTIAIISDVLKPSNGYRVRVMFKYD